RPLGHQDRDLIGMRRFLAFLASGASLLFVSRALEAQQLRDQTTVIDSIDVVGAKRIPPSGVITEFGVLTGKTVSYRDIQRGIETLFSSGQYADIKTTQRRENGKEVLRIEVTERPLLTNWMVKNAVHVTEGALKSKVAMIDGRPYDPAEARRSSAAMDSLYRKRGYYFASTKLIELPQPDGSMRVVFDVNEGQRVAISQISFEGNKNFSDGALVGNM